MSNSTAKNLLIGTLNVIANKHYSNIVVHTLCSGGQGAIRQDLFAHQIGSGRRGQDDVRGRSPWRQGVLHTTDGVRRRTRPYADRSGRSKKI